MHKPKSVLDGCILTGVELHRIMRWPGCSLRRQRYKGTWKHSITLLGCTIVGRVEDWTIPKLVVGRRKLLFKVVRMRR
jgi:hypothetical protein